MTQDNGGGGEAARETPQQLAKRINQDRIRRRMTWPDYAVWIGVKQSTIYKISRGATRLPHDLTLAQINEKLTGDAHEVVSGGQRQPERSEN